MNRCKEEGKEDQSKKGIGTHKIRGRSKEMQKYKTGEV
jgi:hypothetical protein